MNDNEIQNRIQEHLEFALERIDAEAYDWFVICAQGSMNYGLMDEDSDVDTKMLVIPSLRHMALNKKPVSTTLILENDEHCDVKDVREYFKIVRKQNINFVEIFFTQYYIVNPKYADLWYELCAHREEIARANEYRFLKCAKGMMHEKQHALCHPYPSKLDLLEKYGWDGKQLSHAARVLCFADAFICGKYSYETCICNEDINPTLMELKRNLYPATKEEAIEMMEGYVRLMDAMEIEENAVRKDEFDPTVSELLDNVLVELVSRGFGKKEN